jgi:hypothetical protein
MFYPFIFSVLDKIIVQGYKALQLCYFFTAGPDEVKAWTIQVSYYNTTRAYMFGLGHFYSFSYLFKKIPRMANKPGIFFAPVPPPHEYTYL